MGNRNHLLIDSFANEDGSYLLMAIVRNGIDRLLDGEVIPESILIDHNVVMNKMLRNLGKRLPYLGAGHLGKFSRSACNSMSIVALPCRDHIIRP